MHKHKLALVISCGITDYCHFKTPKSKTLFMEKPKLGHYISIPKSSTHQTLQKYMAKNSNSLTKKSQPGNPRRLESTPLSLSLSLSLNQRWRELRVQTVE
ncbi:hypothetical protein TorRG33x02_082550 [Trema orientale]|uniref:Uncharacterized protein n=1 Tax=Trema orientale TaxID=63057 RepID=A0A2P5FDY7_TREOI|nr:hypothetical protein TorRG33x02_082550 [Trema orientale]